MNCIKDKLTPYHAMLKLYLHIAFKVPYFVYRDDHGLGSMAIHLAHHCFSFNMRWM